MHKEKYKRNTFKDLTLGFKAVRDLDTMDINNQFKSQLKAGATLNRN